MLRAIELSGFKSFADRTRMEFVDGISALVGPNGSGKSNIVDAIKWVLGEQSMKKLRGSEATDVIFNGSAGRPPMSSAEVTLTFDNRSGTFNLDTPEVHITRRVYRSGEGEYLINRQASRLKDIKDLLSGTGLGTQAYSIIEQGRVESLLNSSSQQRRVIFEEAAGISRFNARKQEVTRRLERVDQNLIRLSDKVSETEQRLRTTRNQAGKAQLHREYTARLQELRVQAGLIDYRKRVTLCTEIQEEIDRLSQIVAEMNATAEENEKYLADFNAEIERIDLDIRQLEGEIATTRERISGEESTIELQSTQVEEFDSEIVHNGRQLLEQNVRRDDIEEMMRKTAEDIRKAQRSNSDITESYQKLVQQGEQLAGLCKEKEEERSALRKEIETKNRQTAKLAGSLSGLESRLSTLENAKQQNAARLEKLRLQNETATRDCDTMRGVVEQLEDSVRQKLEQLEEAKQRKSERARDLARKVQELSEQKQRQSGMRERISLLEELIRKNEGLSPGVKEVLQQSRNPESPFKHVFGLVADLLQVDVESASLIELALGQHAQLLVIPPKAVLLRHIEKVSSELPGRVGFTWLDPGQHNAPWNGFAGRPGVLGRADQFVKTDPKFVDLAYRFLGQTWIVKNIAVARQLYKESDNQTKFLTVSGEMLTPDGALIVGPINATSGVITRRSELRTLTEQMQLLDAEVNELEAAVAEAREKVANDEIDVEAETRDHQKAVTEFDTQRMKLSSAQERLQQGLEQQRLLAEEIEKLDAQLNRAIEELEQSRVMREELDEQLAVLEIKQIELKRELEEAQFNHEEHLRKTTNAKIELAKSEERVDFLQERVRQFEDHLKERQKLLAEHQRRSRSLKERRESVLLAILRIESTLASLYLKKESMTVRAAGAYQSRHDMAARRAKMQADLKRSQHELQKVQAKVHAKQLELERYAQEQKTLLDRMQEDYAIDLVEVAQRLAVDPRSAQTEEREQGTGNCAKIVESENTMDSDSSDPCSPIPVPDYQSEIEDLRKKLQRLGSVNLEAMETLEELETQYETYSNKYNDLMNAKKLIEKIIEQINTTSQQLFEETFEGVKHHFSTLFRQLFGGGVADLVLEDPTNMLESGVDIVAKPPGKELKSVSLLSGGEKTLTCVALLLAFFKYRPNPVCILDECDAALDEGNIDRFVRVIGEFRTETQFLVITHSKKTMAGATTIYGVTMQESGVSKPISVRFVDVGENGEILDSAAA